METNQQDQQGENIVILPNREDAINDVTSSEEGSAVNKSRKKYHSSALYAASMWHNTVKHVKPVHPPIER